MATSELNQTLGELVATHPIYASVFEKIGIDFCCGGQQTLEAACRKKSLDSHTVLQMLKAFAEVPQTDSSKNIHWQHAKLTDICNFIEQTHHAYLKTELPRFSTLIAKVLSAHGKLHPELTDLSSHFGALRLEMEQHMQKEEMILFPIIREMETQNRIIPSHCGSVKNPIYVMEEEHAQAGGKLELFSQLTQGFQTPPNTCASYHDLMESLHRLQVDLHQHIHLENNILFPRAVKLEQQLS
jgi:regulator of cell morphogenesis and NO signaling